jgi:hypothetical protein
MGKQNRNFKTIFFHFIFPALVLAACDTIRQTQTKQARGLYELTGWNGALVDINSNEAAVIDINGKVGYLLIVSPPTAQCVSRNKKWTGYPKILSGQLPPGMEIDKSNGIKGIPRKAGHWILKIEMSNIKCNDSIYGSMSQELRFHIMRSQGEL